MGVVAPIPLAIGYGQIVFYAQIVAKKRCPCPPYVGIWATRDMPHEVTSTLGVGEGECEEEKEVSDLPSENRSWVDVNSQGVNAARLPATVAAAEAGCLRRVASAMLQNKVWDPGGH